MKRMPEKTGTELRLYREIVENMAEGVFLIRVEDGVIVYANPAIERIFGYTIGELVGKHISAINAPTDKCPEETAQEIIQSLKTNGVWRGEVQNIKKDGTVFWCHANVSTFEHPQYGNVWVAIHQDITERKRVEEAFFSKNEFNRLVIENAGEGICVCHAIQEFPYVHFTVWNKCMTLTTGYSMKEINRLGWYQSMYPDPDVQERAVSRMQSMRVGDDIKGEEWEITRADGKKRLLLITTRLYNGSDGKLYVLGVMNDITERKQAENALRESEERFHSLVVSLNDVIYTLDVEQRHTGVYGDWVNKAGLTPEFFLGKTSRDLFGAEAAHVHEEANKHALAGESMAYEWSAPSANDVQHYQTVVSPLRNSHGEVIGIVGVGRDITDRKRVEEELRNQRTFIENIMETSPVGITTVDARGTIAYANPRAVEILGLTQDAISHITYNAPAWRITDFSGNDFPDENLPFNLVISSGQPVYNVQHAIQWPDGKRVYLSINAAPIKGGEGQITGMVASIEDITERRQAEEALRASTAKLETLIQVSPLAITLLDSNGNVQLWNAAAEQTFGWTSQEVIGHPNPIVPASKQNEYSAWSEQVLRGKPLTNQESVRQRKDGSFVDVSISSAPVYDATGNVTGRMAIVADITARKQVEEKLKEANNRLVEQLGEIKILQDYLREQAIRDSLTGLYNRRYLVETMERELARARRENYSVSIMIMDVDHFKDFNDTFGHQAGDKVLTALGGLLRNGVRQGDIACRYGGDEFFISIPGADEADVERRADTIRGDFNNLRINYGEVELCATISVGVAFYPQHGNDMDAIFKAADAALYEAKQAGRNCVRISR